MKTVTYVFTDIPFRFWIATVLTFLKNGLKLLKDKALEIPNCGKTEAQIWPLE